MATGMGGKGNVLIVDGIPGLSINTGILKGGDVVHQGVRDQDRSATVVGKFDPAIAKTEVLKFLSAHPGTIDGVFQVAGMAPGIFSAFQQLGRPVPPVADIGATAASLAFWRDNATRATRAPAPPSPPSKTVYSMAAALAMLEGRGVKITDIPYTPPVIDSSNLDNWVQPGWTTSTNALSDGPANAVDIPALLNTYFSKP